MADLYNATIDGAFCSLSDVSDVTKDVYDWDSTPSLSSVVRGAELDANDITMDLALAGFPDKTPALVSPFSTEGKALRRWNALRVARRILRDRPTEARSPAAPDFRDLDDDITDARARILQYLQQLSGSSSALASHVTTGDTAASTELTADGAVEEDFLRYVKHDTRF